MSDKFSNYPFERLRWKLWLTPRQSLREKLLPLRDNVVVYIARWTHKTFIHESKGNLKQKESKKFNFVIYSRRVMLAP